MHAVLGTYPISDPAWVDKLKQSMKQAFLQKTAAEWQRILGIEKVATHALGFDGWFLTADPIGLISFRIGAWFHCIDHKGVSEF